MNGNCGGLEKFICSDVECGTKICKRFYNDCDEGHVIRNVPRSLGDKQMADNQSNNGGNNKEVADNEVQEFERREAALGHGQRERRRDKQKSPHSVQHQNFAIENTVGRPVNRKFDSQAYAPDHNTIFWQLHHDNQNCRILKIQS